MLQFALREGSADGPFGVAGLDVTWKVPISLSTGDTAVSDRTMLGYAVLRANYNAGSASYVDNFRFFVIDALARVHPRPQRPGEIGSDLRSRYGLTIPDRVVDQVLRRLPRDWVTKSEKGKQFCLTQKGLDNGVDLDSTVAQFERQQAELATRFRHFAQALSATAGQAVEGNESEILSSYIESQAEPLLAQAVRGGGKKLTERGDDSVPEFVVASFLNDLAEADAALFGYVVDIVKGAMLAAVVDLDTSSLNNRLGGVTLIFDSPLLVKALGYEGELHETAMRQTLTLASNLSARRFCLTRTETEIDGLLASVIPVLKSGGRRAGGLRGIDQHFLAIGASPADVEVERSQFRARLRELGVLEQVATGEYNYSLDEAGLEEMIAEANPDQNLAARRHDVDLIAAVHRLRKGESGSSLERCKFVAVTDHVALGRVARELNKQLGERHGWPLAMMGNELACILWIRQPSVDVDLPRQQLMATVHAGMQPQKHLWRRYLEELETLRRRGSVSDDEAMVLRVEPEAQRVLSQLTYENEYVTAETVTTVRDRLNERIERPLRDGLADVAQERDLLRQGRDSAEEEAANLRAERAKMNTDIVDLTRRVSEISTDNTQRDQNIEVRARRAAALRVWVILALVAIPLAVMSAIKVVYPGWDSGAPGWLSVVGWVCLALAASLGAAKMFFKGSVGEWLAVPQERWARRLERLYRERAGLPPQRDAPTEQ